LSCRCTDFSVELKILVNTTYFLSRVLMYLRFSDVAAWKEGGGRSLPHQADSQADADETKNQFQPDIMQPPPVQHMQSSGASYEMPVRRSER